MTCPSLTFLVLSYRIFSLAAFSGSSEELVGFAIGRTMAISKMETMERHRLGILDNVWDSMHASYVLTLGVVKKWQKQGIATRLLDLFEQEAKGRGAELMFLHVITYNESAIHLYEKCSYSCKTRMRNFYYIQSGRQPEPDRWKWDAFLFVKFFLSEEEARQICRDVRQRQTCLGWNFCWSSSAKYTSPSLAEAVVHGWRIVVGGFLLTGLQRLRHRGKFPTVREDCIFLRVPPCSIDCSIGVSEWECCC